MQRFFVVVLCLIGLSRSVSTGTALQGCEYLHADEVSVEAFAKRTYFYVGGEYVNASLPGSDAASEYMVGQLYVEKLVPRNVTKEYPLVFIHGLAQTATNWLQTPDGREGWASFFLKQGYVVYLADQPQRGRSPWLPGSGEMVALPVAALWTVFTAPQDVHPLPYPQAALHTQWPGSGLPGDGIFDAFYASQVQFQADPLITARLNNHSYVALLDLIGPAIVVAHSQGGPFGWQLGDARPELVKDIVSLEPAGPPFHNYSGPPYTPGYISLATSSPYGLTVLPLQYDPPVGNNPSLISKMVVPPPIVNLSPCTLQAEPARQLVNLAKVPVLLIESQASFASVITYCTAKYLKQAGVKVDFVKLGDVGITGGGHFIFLEKTSLRTAQEVLIPWLKKMST